MLVRGEFYNTLIEKRKDSEELRACMERTVQKLMDSETNMHKPGMLLGKIQGGKTRAFIGIIALAFDNNYDIAIILTKGTRALLRQTYERLKKDFNDAIDNDLVQLHDILQMPPTLTGWELKQKLIMIVKKQTDNLRKAIEAIETTYPDLRNKKVLIIDDEADFASIGFAKNQKEGVFQLRKIASQIDELRRKVKKSDFLQVTATPYSLYLQPDETSISIGEKEFVFEPNRPAFTELLPIYEGYVGGDFYFEESKDESLTAYYVYEELSLEELDVLKKPNRTKFKIEDALTHKRIDTLRRGLLNFIVGGCIRRIQQRKSKQREEKYCFVVHIEQGTQSHAWQIEVVNELKRRFRLCATHNLPLLTELVRQSYDNLSKSIRMISSVPLYEEVLEETITALKDDYLRIIKVNSEAEVVEQLLDDNGELKRTNPFNIFVGGQILDRGITIKNLIGFYYGRRPKRFQQDTVLQHSRMFGNRSKEDLVITRFYTTVDIYSVMERINEFDNALRKAFEKGAQPGVVFICKDESNRIRPCSPNKILISTTTTITPFKRMLPWGFQTGYKTNIRSIIEELDRIINSKIPDDDKNKPFLMELSVANSIIDMIDKTLEFDINYSWDIKAFKASMEFLSKNSENMETQGNVWCLARSGRNISRFKDDGHYSNAPDTGKGDTVFTQAKKTAIDIPVLMLLRQKGDEDLKWRGSPFWWPVIVAPQHTRPVIFASDLIDVD